MPRPAYLARRKSVYYFRARVPTDLVAAYGQSMVFVSLGTGDTPSYEELARRFQ